MAGRKAAVLALIVVLLAAGGTSFLLIEGGDDEARPGGARFELPDQPVDLEAAIDAGSFPPREPTPARLGPPIGADDSTPRLAMLDYQNRPASIRSAASMSG
jgi:hypothetical protein